MGGRLENWTCDVRVGSADVLIVPKCNYTQASPSRYVSRENRWPFIDYRRQGEEMNGRLAAILVIRWMGDVVDNIIATHVPKFSVRR